MIIGDPHEFALWLDSVEAWNSTSFTEGLYALCIDGRILLNRSKLSARAVTLSGESEHWKRVIESIDGGGQSKTDGRDSETLFLIANEAWYGESEVSMPCEGILLSSMDTLDEDWRAYLFVDEVARQDVIVYRYWSENNSELYEFRLPHGRIKETVQKFINTTKVFDKRSQVSAPESRADSDTE